MTPWPSLATQHPYYVGLTKKMGGGIFQIHQIDVVFIVQLGNPRLGRIVHCDSSVLLLLCLQQAVFALNIFPNCSSELVIIRFLDSSQG